MADALSENLGTVCATVGAVTAVTGLAASYYLRRLPKPNLVPTIDLNDQSYVLPDGSRCSKLVPKGEFLTQPFDNVTTLYEGFQRGIAESGDGPCLGTRTGKNLEYEWLSYKQIFDRAQSFGSWMLDEGYGCGKQQVLGIYSANRTEWVVAEQACSTYNSIATALYETLGEEAIVFIINQTEMPMVVCDTSEKANKLLAIHDQIKPVKTIVVMNGMEKVDVQLAKEHHVNVVSFQEALTKGQQNMKKPQPPKPEDIALICYTSGTTGNPKGVVLTHANIVTSIAAGFRNVEAWRPYNKNDVYLSYLPLAHIYERLVQQALFTVGCRIGFFRGDVKLLLEDLQTLRPTIFPCVPRLLNRIYDKVMQGVQKSALKRKLLEWGIAAKKREINHCVLRKDSFWDKLIFNKIQALLGGRVAFMLTASAPLEAKVMDFLRCSFGCVVAEAYGQTECTGGATATIVGANDAGHVGPPLPCNYIKLMDCIDEGYFAKDGKGEVCIKGPNVLQGYYKDPEKTAEAIDKDGWLHTGDVGQWLPNGTLKIIDRKKHLFKLAQGEYVSPEKIELVYIRSLYVAQAFVDGDSLMPYIMAVIVPDEEVLVPWAKENNLSTDFKELCQSESVKDMILADINRLGREAGLNGYELAKDIHLQSELFSVENELLTPTFKNKRPYLRKHFGAEIAALYKKHQS